MNKPINNGRVTRWIILLKEFNVTILNRPRKQNLVANFLSKIKNEGETSPIEDNFPIEILFVVSIKSPCFSDIENYLSKSKLPSHLYSR